MKQIVFLIIVLVGMQSCKKCANCKYSNQIWDNNVLVSNTEISVGELCGTELDNANSGDLNTSFMINGSGTKVVYSCQ